MINKALRLHEDHVPIRYAAHVQTVTVGAYLGDREWLVLNQNF